MVDTTEALADALLAGNGKAARQAFTRMLDEEGFAIVPKVPTIGMWAAGGDAVVATGWVHHDKITEAVWSAMVAAGRISPAE